MEKGCEYIYRYDMSGMRYKYPSLALANAEISKVCQEISTNYRKYQGKEFVMHRSQDLDGNWCIYYVENRGYGDYNIVEKLYD